jgi:hypothetical protein
MANSRRVYITLNSEKEKDRIIEEFLSKAYSEGDLIKETLYRLATQGNNLKPLNINSIEKVQKVTTKTKKVRKDAKSKSDNKVLKGSDDTEELLKDDNSSITEKEQIETNDTQKVQINDDNDNEELNKNMLDALDQYF